jgi:hypothetical protein
VGRRLKGKEENEADFLETPCRSYFLRNYRVRVFTVTHKCVVTKRRRKHSLARFCPLKRQPDRLGPNQTRSGSPCSTPSPCKKLYRCRRSAVCSAATA